MCYCRGILYIREPSYTVFFRYSQKKLYCILFFYPIIPHSKSNQNLMKNTGFKKILYWLVFGGTSGWLENSHFDLILCCANKNHQKFT